MTTKAELIESEQFKFNFDTCDEMAGAIKGFTLVGWKTFADWTKNELEVTVMERKRN